MLCELTRYICAYLAAMRQALPAACRSWCTHGTPRKPAPLETHYHGARGTPKKACPVRSDGVVSGSMIRNATKQREQVQAVQSAAWCRSMTQNEKKCIVGAPLGCPRVAQRIDNTRF